MSLRSKLARPVWMCRSVVVWPLSGRCRPICAALGFALALRRGLLVLPPHVTEFGHDVVQE
eukprot:2856635-Alexandrium_andersonii.AAC.1